jgi:hypothetical protein
MRSKVNRSESGPKRLLEDRIVLCADCDTNRPLAVGSCGALICSSCGSENWMFVAAPIVRNFREYNEKEVRERVAVDRYIAKLEREEFFVPHDVLV